MIEIIDILPAIQELTIDMKRFATAVTSEFGQSQGSLDSRRSSSQTSVTRPVIIS